MAYAAYNVGDLIITSGEPVTVNMTPYDKVYTSSNTNPVSDGGERGPNYMKRDGSLTYATNGLKVAIGIVLAIDATGVHIKKKRSWDVSVAKDKCIGCNGGGPTTQDHVPKGEGPNG